MIDRRFFTGAGGLWLACAAFPPCARAAALAEIRMRSDVDGAAVWFDPVGLWVEPGTTVRWVIESNVHTVTAYHPDNEGHSLRIPETAHPWDSGYLVNPGDAFEVTLTVPGVYDYYCAPHEEGGMVGRIVVGTPSGPGSKPFDYFKTLDPVPSWRDVPDAAQRNFPSIDRIVADGRVHRSSSMSPESGRRIRERRHASTRI